MPKARFALWVVVLSLAFFGAPSPMVESLRAETLEEHCGCCADDDCCDASSCAGEGCACAICPHSGGSVALIVSEHSDLDRTLFSLFLSLGADFLFPQADTEPDEPVPRSHSHLFSS